MDLRDVAQLLATAVDGLTKTQAVITHKNGLIESLSTALMGINEMRDEVVGSFPEKPIPKDIEAWSVKVDLYRVAIGLAAQLSIDQSKLVIDGLNTAESMLVSLAPEHIAKLDQAVHQIGEARSIISVNAAEDRSGPMLPIHGETCSYRIGKAITLVNEVLAMLPGGGS